MSALIGIVMAIAAILAQPQAPADEFTQGLLADCHPHVEWHVFVGCESTDETQDEGLYAGLIWVDGQATLETGP
jgi:hypothetical protein